MSDRPRAALYARVSTAGQVTKDEWASLPRQMEDMRALCQRMGLAVALEVEEQGSGAKADRPGWRRVLEAARAGEVEAIVAVAFDRLTRSEKLGEFESLKHELRGLGVRLVTVKQGEINLSGSADAEMLSDVQAVWAKGERLKIKERTYAGRTAKAAAGGYSGGNIPYGYEVGYHPKTGEKVFTVREDEAAVVRDLYARFVAGDGVNELTRRLIQAGTPAPGKPHDSAPGVHWYISTVQGILENPTYAGLQSWRDDRGPLVPSTAFPALVEMDTWQQAQREREVRAHRSPRGPKAPHPLSGILRCPDCEGKMNHYTTEGVGYYRCARDWRLGPKQCTSRLALNAGACEAAVLAVLREHLAALAGGPMKPKKGKAAPDMGKEIARLERERAKLETERTNLLRWVARDPDEREGDSMETLAQFRRELAALDERLAALRKQALVASPQAPLVDFPVQLVEVLDDVATVPAALRKLFDRALLEATCVRTSKPRARPQTVAVRRLIFRGGYVLDLGV